MDSAAARQSLSRDERVRRSREYLRAYRRGRRRTGSLVTLHFFPNETPLPRLGVTVSRKVGNSVVRHRVKRRIVEVFRRFPGRPRLQPWDLVVHVHPRAADAPFPALREELEGLLRALPEARR